MLFALNSLTRIFLRRTNCITFNNLNYTHSCNYDHFFFPKEISDNLKLGGAKPTQLTDQYKAQGVKDGHHFFAVSIYEL